MWNGGISSWEGMVSSLSSFSDMLWLVFWLSVAKIEKSAKVDTKFPDWARVVVSSKKTVSNAISKKYVESFSLYNIHEWIFQSQFLHNSRVWEISKISSKLVAEIK